MAHSSPTRRSSCLTAHRSTCPIQSLSDRPLANQTTISDSLKLRVTVVSTAMNRDTDKMTGSAVMLENAARPKTTLAPILPLAASPRRRTSKTLSQTTSKVEKTTPAWLMISETTERLNKDMRKYAG